MQWLANDRAAASELGKHGQRAVQERLSSARLQGIVRQRLGRLLIDSLND
jgi:hypothetical protein